MTNTTWNWALPPAEPAKVARAIERGQLTLHVDAWLTRRKRYVIITDERDETIFIARTVSQALGWLTASEITEFCLSTPNAIYRARLEEMGRSRKE